MCHYIQSLLSLLVLFQILSWWWHWKLRIHTQYSIYIYMVVWAVFFRFYKSPITHATLQSIHWVSSMWQLTLLGLHRLWCHIRNVENDKWRDTSELLLVLDIRLTLNFLDIKWLRKGISEWRIQKSYLLRYNAKMLQPIWKKLAFTEQPWCKVRCGVHIVMLCVSSASSVIKKSASTCSLHLSTPDVFAGTNELIMKNK